MSYDPYSLPWLDQCELLDAQHKAAAARETIRRLRAALKKAKETPARPGPETETPG